MYVCMSSGNHVEDSCPVQAPSPKKSVLRVDVVGICLNETMGERNCFDIVFKSGDRWVMSAGSEVILCK